MNVTLEQLANLFEIWDTRYRTNPEEFVNIVDHLLHSTSSTYGEVCAIYLNELYREHYESN